jgi:hypothetical protein
VNVPLPTIATGLSAGRPRRVWDGDGGLRAGADAFIASAAVLLVGGLICGALIQPAGRLPS